MTKHIVTIIAITALILLCMFLPFVPGRYDSSAISLSFMAQLFSFSGLLLVPLGAFWLWFEITNGKAAKANQKRKTFAITTLAILGLILIIASLGMLTNYNLSFGIFFLAAGFYFLIRAFLKVRKGGLPDNLKFHPAPIYLIAIPIVVALCRFAFFDAAVQFSREYAIRKSEPLITEIEEYHTKHGKYPVSLQALHSDILPEMIGIKQYHYEPNGKAYNLYFKQFSDELDVEEIVMYNKLGEHAFAGHALDILEYSGDELSLRRGDRHRYKLAVPHWIYIKFE